MRESRYSTAKECWAEKMGCGDGAENRRNKDRDYGNQRGISSEISRPFQFSDPEKL